MSKFGAYIRWLCNLGENSKFKRLTDFLDVNVQDADICECSLDKFLLRCRRCGSTRVTSKGRRRNKRKGEVKRYYCKDCRHKFSDGFPGHLPLQIVEDILRWIVEGRSPVNIANDIRENYGVRVSPQTIINVIKRYVNFFLQFESTRRHKLESKVWQIDDTPQIFPKSGGTTVLDAIRRLAWITNVLAVDPRYWLSAYVSLDRTEINTSKAMKMAVQRAKYAPIKVKCDAYRGHIAGIRRVYPFIEIDWKSKKENFGYINLIESLHSFIRRKGIRKRGRFRSIENLQVFIELLRIYYNFLHIHKALGTTPAAKAGVAPSFNSWSDFIRYVFRHLK